MENNPFIDHPASVDAFRREYIGQLRQDSPSRQKFPRGYRPLLNRSSAVIDQAMLTLGHPAMNKDHLLMAIVELYPEQVLAAASSMRMKGMFDPTKRRGADPDALREALSNACDLAGVHVLDVSTRLVREYRSFDMSTHSIRDPHDGDVEIIIRGRNHR